MEVDSAVKASTVLRQESIPVLFLDVEMPDMSGLEFIETLPYTPLVVLCTANKEYAMDAFDHGVVDFLLKPVKYARFLKAANKVREVLSQSRTVLAPAAGADGELVAAPTTAADPALYVKSESNLHRIPLADILWVEALADYVIVNTAKDRRVVHMTMKAVEARLPQPQFMRVHRSFVVALGAITTIRGDIIHVGEKQIPIGGTYRDGLFKQLNILN